MLTCHPSVGQVIYYRMTLDIVIPSNPDWLYVQLACSRRITYIEPAREYDWDYIDMTAIMK